MPVPPSPLLARPDYEVMLLAGLPGHAPTRPEWICRRCTRAWPCPPVRTQLADEMRSNRPAAVTVARLLGRCLVTAIYDQPETGVDPLYQQILHWLLTVPLPDAHQ